MRLPFLPLFLRALATVAAGVAATSSAFAQANAPVSPATPSPAAGATTPAATPLSATDKAFVENTAASVYYLLETAKTANTLLTDSRLAKFRAVTLRDMNRTWDAITKLSKAKGVNVPTELTMPNKLNVERLGKLKDAPFAKQWVEDLDREGTKLSRTFDSAPKVLQDVDVKMFCINYDASFRRLVTGTEAAKKLPKATKK